MSWSRTAHTSNNLAAGGGTTSAIDTTGASLIAVAVGSSGAPLLASLTDSASNTWTLVRTQKAGTDSEYSGFYVCTPAKTSATHTFTFTQTSSFASICVAAFSGGPGVLDKQNSGGTNAVTSQATGSVTTASGNELLLSSAAWGQVASGTAPTVSIDNSFTISDQQATVFGANYGCGLAYLNQSAAGAINPTWSINQTQSLAAIIATYAIILIRPSTVGNFQEMVGSLCA